MTHPVARHICARPSSGKADGVQEPVAIITNPALNTESSVHWTPVVLPSWPRRILWTLLPGRTLPFRATTSVNNIDNPWPAFAQPPSWFRYPLRSSNVAVRTSGGNTERTWSPFCNCSKTAPKATSFLYDSLTYEIPPESEEPRTSTPDLGVEWAFWCSCGGNGCSDLDVLMISITPFFLVLPQDNCLASEFGIHPIRIGAPNDWNYQGCQVQVSTMHKAMKTRLSRLAREHINLDWYHYSPHPEQVGWWIGQGWWYPCNRVATGDKLWMLQSSRPQPPRSFHSSGEA